MYNYPLSYNYTKSLPLYQEKGFNPIQDRNYIQTDQRIFSLDLIRSCMHRMKHLSKF